MGLYLMCADAEGGGTDYFIVSAEDGVEAYGLLGRMEKENIECLNYREDPDQFEAAFSEFYDQGIAILGTV